MNSVTPPLDGITMNYEATPQNSLYTRNFYGLSHVPVLFIMVYYFQY
jgi:hypothetical protein